MLRQMLLATDLSPRCDRAFDRAIVLAREAGARLTIATALESSPDDLVEPEARPHWRRRDGLADARRQIRNDLEDKGLDARIVVRRATAGELIASLARENPYDLIVTGIARSTGLSRMILGATVEAILRKRAAPVLVVKRRVRGSYRSVLVGTDFSEPSRAALQVASALFPQARLTVLHAYHAPGLAGMEQKDNVVHRRALDDCARFVAATLAASPHGIRCVAEAGIPEALLHRYAVDKKVDLLAVGTHGRHPLLDLLFGSTCAALIRASPSDTLLVPHLRDASAARGVT